ncbi:MAG TPA: choice-of-anchor tandem repeat GloVer-containing protein [Ideonella sp.]|nr:choice-of-anchor tandem repeat GloVer-containing protein [Ideonella sp.]
MLDRRSSPSSPAHVARRRCLAALASLALAPGLLAAAPRPAAAPSAATYEVVHAFTGGAGGANPTSLMFTSDGTLYGIAQLAGANQRGAIFRLRGGVFEIAHAFADGEVSTQDWDQGKLDPLVQGPDGKLYGTTFDGGSAGLGLAYRLEADDTLVPLHHFGGGEDGERPNDQLATGPDGALYGTAATAGGGGSGLPLVYRMALDGSVTPLAQIGTWLNGLSRQTLASDGNFYSMSQYGGIHSHGGAQRMAPDGRVTAIYSVGFNRPSMVPSGGFVQHADGLLYGTTEISLDGSENGTVFRMTLDGKVKILHHFLGPEGRMPFGLVVGSDGALYGATIAGGPAGYGVVYRISPDGAYTVLHSFDRFEYPLGRLALGPDGRLYGVTSYGGTGKGSIYAVAVESLRRAAAPPRR